MKGAAIHYSDTERAWLADHRHLPRRELHARFCETFGRGDVNAANIKSYCTRQGWKTGRTGCFDKGNVPHNKGKAFPVAANHPNCRKTQFQKGHRGGKAAKLYKPIGTERVSKDGYIERKIHDGMPFQSRWRAVHLIRWEAINGAVPDGHALKCLDGDRRNTDPDNWIAIPRALLPRLAGRWASMPFDQAPAELKPILLQIARMRARVSQIENSRD